MQSAMYSVVQNGDYLEVICEKCGEPCHLDYKGLDPVMPLIESGEWKLHNPGDGFYKLTKPSENE